MGDIDAKTLLERSAIFTEFKGALTEQYVFQQLNSTNEFVIYYWSGERSTSEIDLLIQHMGIYIPVEVKAEENLQAKSLKVFREKFNPEFSVVPPCPTIVRKDGLLICHYTRFVYYRKYVKVSRLRGRTIDTGKISPFDPW